MLRKTRPKAESCDNPLEMEETIFINAA